MKQLGEYRLRALQSVVRCAWCNRQATGLDQDGDPDCLRCAELAAGCKLDALKRLARLCDAYGLPGLQQIAAERNIPIERVFLLAEQYGIPRMIRSTKRVKAPTVRTAKPAKRRISVPGVKAVTHAGETLTVSEWSIRTGLPADVINQRIRHSWTPKRALETPFGRRGSRPTVNVTRRAA